MATDEVSALFPVLNDEQSSEASEKLPFLYAPHYRFKIFRSKGAVLVLFWSFTASFMFHFLSKHPDHKSSLDMNDKAISPLVVFSMCLLFSPFLGWLADVKYGRYKIMKWGLWTMWAMSILFCLASALLSYFFPLSSAEKLPQHFKLPLLAFLYVPFCLGLGGFLSNIFQFGIDQLVDASSREIKSFIRWCIWLWFLSSLSTAMLKSCISTQYESFGYLLFPSLLTGAIALDFLFNHWLIKEPVSKNPFDLIFNVLRFAVKNKYPRLRSAFSYWDDRHHSRIDLAKHKYGGPFTTEQVEDVKTCFRIMSVTLVVCLFIGVFLSSYPVYHDVLNHLADKNVTYLELDHCMTRIAVVNAGDMVVLLALPIFEFVLNPLFKRYFGHVSILRKISLGLVILLLSMTALTAIEFVANRRQNSLSKTCTLFKRDDTISLSLDYKIMILPFVLTPLSQTLIGTSFVELMCAQSPYSMKGLLFGFGFGATGFFTMVGYGIMRAIAAITEKWLSDEYGCMSWYLLIILVLSLVTLAVFFLVFKCYKKRSRDDEHNEHMFAES